MARCWAVAGLVVASVAWGQGPPDNLEERLAQHGRAPTERTRTALLEAARPLARECRRQRKAGAYPEAVVACRGAHEATLAAQGAEHLDTIEAEYQLAKVLSWNAVHDEAERRFRQVLMRWEAQLGPEHLSVSDALTQLGRLFENTGRLPEAIEAHRRALAIREAVRGPKHAKVATSLGRLGQALLSTGDFDAAEPFLRRALAIQETENPRHLRVAIALNSLASLSLARGDFDEAVAQMRRVLEITEAVRGPEHPTLATVLNNLGATLAEVGAYEESEQLHRRALAIVESALGPDHPTVALTLGNLAGLLNARGEYRQSEPMLRRSLAIYEASLAPDHPRVAIGLNNLASVLETLGAYAEAETLHRRAIAAFEARLGPDHPSLASSLNNLALMLVSTGAYPEAEALCRRSLGIREAALGPTHPHVADSLSNLANVLEATGAYEEAEALYRRALGIQEAALGPNHPRLAIVLNNVGSVLRTSGKHAEAEPLLRRALAVQEASLGTDHLDVAATVSDLAELQRDLGALEEATRLQRRVVTIRESVLGPDHPRLSVALYTLATIHEERGEDAEAERLYRRALAIDESSLGADHPFIARNLGRLARMKVRQGALDEALPLWRRALEVEEAKLASDLWSGTPARRRQFLAQNQGSVSAVVALAMDRVSDGRASELALSTVLRRKGRLADVQRDIFGRLRQVADPTSLQWLDELERATAYQSVLQDQVPAAADELRAWQSRRDELAAEVDELQRKLASRSGEVRQAVRQVTVEAVAEALPVSTGLLELVVFRPLGRPVAHYGAFLLRPDGQIEAVDLGPATTVDRDVAGFRDALRTRSPVQLAAAALFDRVFGPLAEELASLEHLYVAADGTLSLIPLEAVLSAGPSPSRGARSVTYLTSGRDLLREPARDTTDPAVVVYGVDYDAAARPSTVVDPSVAPRGPWSALEGTFDEGRVVARSLRRPRELVGTRATETALKAVRGPRVLHIASHGYFDGAGAPLELTGGVRSSALVPTAQGGALSKRLAGDPLMRSVVVLAGANLPPAGEDNGRLTAAELAQIDLRGTKVVVVSACETGVGEVRNGDGVLGLRRAVVLAGARAQVLSLWRVDDEATAALMKSFYRQLRRGRPVGEALRRAQKRIASQPRWAHPYFWAAFTVSGESNARL